MKYDYVIIGAGPRAILRRGLPKTRARRAAAGGGADYPNFEDLPEEVKFGYATEADVMTSDHNWQFVGRATDEAPPMMVPRGKVTAVPAPSTARCSCAACPRTTTPGLFRK